TLYKLYAYVVGFRSAVGSSGGEAVRSGEQAPGGQHPAALQPPPPPHPSRAREWVASVATESSRWPSTQGTNSSMRRKPLHIGHSWFTRMETALDAMETTTVSRQLLDATEPLRQFAKRNPAAKPTRHIRAWAKSLREDEVWRARKVRIFPDTRQKDILRQAVGTYRWTYNRAVHILKTYTGPQPSLTQLRQECVNDEAFDGDADMAWVFRSAYAIREQAVMEAMDAFLATKRRGSGELKFRKKRALFGTLRLPARQWKGGFQKTYEYWEGGIEVSTEMWSGGEILGLKDEGGQPFGFVAAEEPVSATWEGGGSLSWENGVWYLMVPFVSGKPSDVAEGHRICAIDPGIRTFATVYDPLRQKAFQWGTGRDVKFLLDVALKIDNLLGKMHAPDIRHRARYRMKRAVSRYRMRLRHLVMEIHKKFALWLSKNYDTVLLPSLSAHGISARGRRKIRKSTVREMFSWAHGKFRDRLSSKISFVEIKEHYTSRTCSQCGADNPRLGGKSVFRCPSPACGLEADRDVNAAKNIFLKWLHDFHQDASFACKLRRRQ
ncbi:hypothetical protein A4X13_0g6496, partial [Tilletia indica]